MTDKSPGSSKLYLDCVHCGLCLSSCPTYRVLGSEMDSPRGRIYLMRAFDEGRTPITDSFVEHMYRCLDCRACETACPSGVHFGQMMEDMRAEINSRRTSHGLERMALEYVFPYPRRFRAAAALLKLYQRSGLQRFVRSKGILERLSPELARAERLSPQVEPGAGVKVGGFHPAEGTRQGKVAFFSGCVMNSVMGSVNRASVRLLTAAGFDVTVPAGQVCCGALANHSGLRDVTRSMALSNIAAFPKDVDAIIINAAGCGSTLKEYHLLLDEAGEFSSRVQDISEFLARTRLADRLRKPLKGRVGYDDPCHLIHGQRIRNEPRQLLRAIPGIEFVEVEEADRCCGSAGTYNLSQPELSNEILDAKMRAIARARLDVLATGNPGCIFQIRYGAEKHKLPLRVVHPVELLAEALV